MNAKLVVGLGLTGVLPPAILLALRQESPLVAVLLWTLLAALVWVPLVLRAKEERPFVTLLAVGALAGVAAGAVDAGATGDPMLFVMALVIGTVWGALFGAVALGVRRARSA